ncbi:MAG: hypothetical protein MJ219_00595 [Mycoplasmoidaceae bacterium]|nr:hypothetical protein [Mycoplasmoidaceae bacterium]
MFSGCISLEVRQQDTKTVDEGFIFTCPTDLPDYAVVQMFASCITTGFTGDPTPGYSYY